MAEVSRDLDWQGLLPGVPERSPFFSVLRRRILHRHDKEGWDGLVDRVVDLASEAEDLYDDAGRQGYLNELSLLLRLGAFLPNSPLLVNSGERRRRLFACFALDAREPLQEFLTVARQVHDGMGGVGYSIDGRRESGELASLIRAIDHDTARHQVGRPRPASNSATVDVEHPRVRELFALTGTINFTNLNVGMSDHFMEAVQQRAPRQLSLFREVVFSIHQTGQPGVVFTDRIPRIARERDTSFAANVCGEAPLAADESGLLGSINLLQFLKPHKGGLFALDESAFERAVCVALRFLDGMHDLHDHPSARLHANSVATRKVGVGIMGFAHYLALVGCRYGSGESVKAAARVGKLLSDACRFESERLGHTRGVFPAWTAAMPFPSRRNAMLAAVAGTATLSLLVGTTGGVEPIFSLVSRHRVMGEEIVSLDAAARIFSVLAGRDPDNVGHRLQNGSTAARELGSELASFLPTAHEVPGHEHIFVQAALQREIDGGITKTVNCPTSTTVDEIDGWIRLAFEQGCMGATVYRDGSVESQPVTSAVGAPLAGVS